MPALAITLNQLAAALLGAGAYIYHTKQRREWKACTVVCGCLIQRSSPDPYCAIAQVAQVLIDYDAQQAAQDLVLTPAARAAYKAAWAASEGQPVPARFAAAEAAEAAAAAAATESAECHICYETIGSRANDCTNCLAHERKQKKTHKDESADWPSTIRTEQDNAHTMQRLHSITGRPSAAEAAAAASSDEQLADDDDSELHDDLDYEDEPERIYRSEQRIAHEQARKEYSTEAREVDAWERRHGLNDY